MRAVLILLVVLAAVGGATAYYAANYLNADPPSVFRTAVVKQDTLLITIGATGTAEPEDLIDVGAQVTGPIASLGMDPKTPTKRIDYCSEVEPGTLLVKIDDSVYKAQYDQAMANLLRAKADMGQLQAHVDQTRAEWKRAESLLPKKAIAATDYDLAEANWKVAVANLEVGKTAIKQAEAAVAMAKRNLDYCTIRSPVKGVIIDRRVNVGQTVVSNMNVSSICLIAKDLSHMQVWAQVNEADIGRVHVGLPVHFTLATYPGETFEGRVTQVRLNAQSTQNVVTYTVVVTTDNPPTPDHPNGKLLPYMTADLKFEVERHPDVLLVPNAALRWKPQQSQITPERRHKTAGNASAAKAGEATATKQPAVANTAEEKPQPHYKHIWVTDGDFVRPVRVRIGQSDGVVTEVSGDEVKQGMKVVIGESRGAADEEADDTKNPFVPQIRHTNAKPKQ